MSRIIAIGDIHGCSTALRTLIDAIQVDAHDTVVPLGDFIDRGPDSRGVIDQLLELQHRCHLVPLIGNHEVMLLAVLRGVMDGAMWLHYGGSQTVTSYGGDLADFDTVHREFLEGCYRFLETGTHFFVHANFAANLKLEDTPENTQLWTHITSWCPTRHHSGKTGIVGHTPQASGELLDLGHLVCIDTCCFGNGWLTALDVTTGQVWQANQQGQLNHARQGASDHEQQ